MIILDRSQCDEADDVAILRRAFALKQNRPQNRGFENLYGLERLYYDCLGARAELAAHLLFRVPWRPYSENEVVRNGDLAGFVEVKGVSRPRDRLLIKVEKANEKHAYLLFDGSFHPAWYPIGWIWGVDAMQDKWRQKFSDDQPDCFVVPRTMPPLHPVRELFDIVKETQNEALRGT